MKRISKNKRGISLIVLVITIIVMIILAAAIILSLSGNGIIGRANEAKVTSDVANKKQAATVALSEYELEKRTGKLESGTTPTSYVVDRLEAQGIDASDVAVDEDYNIIVGSGGSAIQKGVKVGDYVTYTPTTVTSTKYQTNDELAFSTQTGENALTWKYMGVDEKGNALLVSETPTTGQLLLELAEGYLQGPNKLNELCKELYSGELGEARSIDLDDVNMVLEANPVSQYCSSNNREYINNPDKLTIGQIVSQKKEPALTYTDTPDGTTDINTYVADYYDYVGKKYKAEATEEYKMIFTDGASNEIHYWLASNSVYVDFSDGYGMFGVRLVSFGEVSSIHLFNSDGGRDGSGRNVRPVIMLKSNVIFGTKTDGVWSIS